MLLALGASPVGSYSREGTGPETPFALASVDGHGLMARLLACSITPGLNERPLFEAAATDASGASANQDAEDEKDTFLRAAAANDWFSIIVFSSYLIRKHAVSPSNDCCQTQLTGLLAIATETLRYTLFVAHIGAAFKFSNMQIARLFKWSTLTLYPCCLTRDTGPSFDRATMLVVIVVMGGKLVADVRLVFWSLQKGDTPRELSQNATVLSMLPVPSLQ
jgi:hypothetical protein